MNLLKTKTYAVFVSCVLILIATQGTSAAQAQSVRQIVTKGNNYIRQKKFKEATDCFFSALKQRPRSPVLYYYLGTSYLYQGNMRAAKASMARSIALSANGSKMNKQAVQTFYKYWRYKPYSALVGYTTPPDMRRWARKKMPLAVWIADGTMLPNHLNKKIMDAQETMDISQGVKNRQYLARLQKSSFYKTPYKAALIKGIEKWNWAVRERLLSYKFVNNPAKADILIFWSNELRGFAGWAYHPAVIPGQQYAGIIVMNLRPIQGREVKDACHSLTFTMCHEFGHILGMDHSPNEEDVMFARNTAENFSQGDYSSFRALYSLPPHVTFPSVSKPN